MKKVIYSITRLGKNENTKITGVGFIAEEQLLTAGVSKTGKTYVRAYDCVKDCHPIPNSTDEFKGAYYEIVEIDVEKNGSYEKREIEVNYYIWYKLAE